jgi:hypothetical protein
MLGISILSSQSGRIDLQNLSELIQVGYLFRRILGDVVTAPAARLDQAYHRQAIKRLSNRRPADAH